VDCLLLPELSNAYVRVLLYRLLPFVYLFIIVWPPEQESNLQPTA
jgi:hypothetical protein